MAVTVCAVRALLEMCRFVEPMDAYSSQGLVMHTMYVSTRG